MDFTYIHIHSCNMKCLNRYSFFCLLVVVNGRASKRINFIDRIILLYKKMYLREFSPRIPHLICPHYLCDVWVCKYSVDCFPHTIYVYYSVDAALASCISFRLDLIMRFHFNLSNNILWLYLNGLEYAVFIFCYVSKYEAIFHREDEMQN